MHLTEEINQLRKDNIQTALTTEEGLLNAPLKDDAYFLVPKVIKK
jgi:aspartyl-tRNA(Asn)/glutamyl-tRNA(Gln) amidotransferase subunit C